MSWNQNLIFHGWQSIFLTSQMTKSCTLANLLEFDMCRGALVKYRRLPNDCTKVPKYNHTRMIDNLNILTKTKYISFERLCKKYYCAVYKTVCLWIVSCELWVVNCEKQIPGIPNFNWEFRVPSSELLFEIFVDLALFYLYFVFRAKIVLL